MIERMKDMKRVFVVSSLLLVISFTAMAQIFGATQAEEQPAFGVSAPSATFHSTSALPASGSEYAANPTLNADGSVAYEGASYSPSKAPFHPGYIKRDGFDGENQDNPPDPTPLGDVVWPLMMLLCAYAGYKKVRARKEGLSQ